jgi:O-antigen/teichoic acid export membrane protein
MSETAAKWVVPENAAAKPAAWQRHAATFWRYAPSIIGPISVSAAHFIASLIFLRELPPIDFGLLAFLLVVSPFLCISIGGSLLLTPLGVIMAKDKNEASIAMLHTANPILSFAAGVATFVLLLLSHTSFEIALLLAPYCTLMSLRWYGRGHALAEQRSTIAMLSDATYAISLVGGLLLLLALQELSMTTAAYVLLGASVLGLAALGGNALKRQISYFSLKSLAHYKPVWQDYSRWAVLGVILSELTANAHAYLVTFISGPRAFATLAVGALVMRPVSLVLSALPDLERPAMARALAAGNKAQALRSVNEFRTAGGAIWLLTILFAGALLLWFPHVLLKHRYDEIEVLLVIAVWAAIMMARVFRTPESVLLQAAGEFKPLASASTKSSVVSVIATLALLLMVGPLAALGGILLGELVMTAATVSLFRGWKARHG